MSKEKVIIPSTKLKCDKCGEYFDDGEGGMCIPYDTDGSEIKESALEEGDSIRVVVIKSPKDVEKLKEK